MENKILPKKSTESGRKPTSLQLSDGEVAVNYPDQQWYGKNPSTHQVVPIGAPYVHSHDQLFSLNPATGGPGGYDLEITNDGDLTISDGSIITTISPSSSVSRTITLPDKTGTIALLDDITGGGGGGLVSQSGTKKIILNNDGSLNYDRGEATDLAFTLPGGSGTLAIQGGDTIISSAPPLAPYVGLRWVDSDLMRSFDWIIDPSTGLGAWVETGVGADGRQVDLRLSGGYIQWRYVGDASWVNLVALQDIKGDAGVNGASAELRVNSTHIQWKTADGVVWNDLVDLNQIKGAAGADAAVTSANISAALGYLPDNPTSARTPTDHYHMVNGVDRYYTRAEADTLLAAKQASGNYSVVGHGHDASQITGVLSVDQIPVLPSQVPVVATSIPTLTSTQQSAILAGTVLITADGKRYVYKGEGSKTSESSYIVLADISPTWSAIADKPLTFTATSHQHPSSDVTGLAAVATSGKYSDLVGAPTIPSAQVSSDWSAATGVAAILNKPNLAKVATSGDYNDLINKPAAAQRVSKSAWASPYHYYGYADSGTAENQVGWTIRRITTTSAGAVSSSLSASGAWSNRANLNYL